jgi:NAD(P)-dependent dehydrogenase (short-subunit alcohol dehydrogenase family)
MNAFRLDGEIALITGGGTGLGLGMASCMAEAGAKVIVTGRREAVLREAVKSIGHDARYVVHDVSDFKTLPALLADVKNLAGDSPTILINNAGSNVKKPALEISDDEFVNLFNTHVTGAVSLAKAVAPAMISRKHGSILFIASMASLFGIPQIMAYSAAKSALLGVVRSLAVEWSPSGVRVNAIAPGWIETAMVRQAFAGDPQRSERILQRTPMHRLGEASDVGHAAVYLSSAAAKFVTGVVLPVDGGVSIGF